MPTVVMSGGNGFLGSHVASAFADAGYQVYSIVRNAGNQAAMQRRSNIHMVQGFLNQTDKLKAELPDKPDAFFHFAWQGVAPNRRDEIGQLYNVEMSLAAVRLASSINANFFVFPGSTLEYLYCDRPINRMALPSPPNLYSAAKVSARYLCEQLCRTLGVPFIYTVISGIYSEDRSDNNVIDYTINQLLRGEKPHLTALDQLWDYVHIDDVTAALRLVIEKGKANAFYSIGHGDNFPLRNYIFMIRDIINPMAELGIGDIPYPSNRLPSSCVDLTELYNDTGFVPRIAFQDGIRRVIEAKKAKKVDSVQ